MNGERFKNRISFEQGFSAAVAANQKVWAHDRSSTVGASEVFSCHRMVFFKKRHPELADLAEEVDPEWGHAERGNLIENQYVVPTLRHMFGEERCLFMGEDQRTLVDGHLSATPDGLVVGLERDVMADYGIEDIGDSHSITTEVKTFGGEFAAPKKVLVPDPNDLSKNITRYQAKAKHHGQNIVQMGVFQRKTNYQPNVGVVIYVNPVNLKDIRPAPVVYDANIYARAKKRSDDVFDLTLEAKDFPAEGKISGNDCNYCDFCTACSKVDLDRFPSGPIKTSELSQEVQTELEALTREVAEVRAKHKVLDAEKKEKEAVLKERLLSIGTTRAGGDGWGATIIRMSGRKSLDKDRIAADFDIDLEQYEKQGEPYLTLRTKAE